MSSRPSLPPHISYPSRTNHQMSVSSTIVGDHEDSHPEKAPSSSKPLSSYTLRKLPWQTYTTPFEQIVAEKYPGSGTEEDPYIIDWIHEDAEDPQRWPLWYRWVTIAIVSWTTLAVALSSSAYSGGIKPLIIEFGASQELLIAGVSLFVVGFAFGPLLWAPLSEVYGRRNVFIVSYFFLTIWTVACAVSQTVAQLLVFRFLCGFFGSSPLANAGGVITDVLNAKQRGLGMALFAAAPFLGPALGPITGGFLGDSAGWRWIEGFLAIFCGVILILLIVACPETYAPTLLRRRADKLSRATGKVYRVPADKKGKLQLGPLFAAALSRPWKFLIFEPIVSILTLYTAVLYGILYLNFAAYPIIFQQQRGWSAGIGGLAFLGILVGTVLSIIVSVVRHSYSFPFQNGRKLMRQVYIQPQYLRTLKKRGYSTPEDRLPPAIWGGVLVVIGLAGFAATNGPDVHWIAPIIFGVPFGLGIIVSFLATIGYLVDSYTIYAASVLAANSVLRSLFGAAFPLFTSYMYRDLGTHWASALPGFIALALVPFCYIFWRYGAKIRARCRYAADAEKQMKAIMAMRQKQAEAYAKAHAEKDAGHDAEAAQAGPANAQDVQAEATGVENENTVPAQTNPALSQQGEEWDMYTVLADRDEVDLSDEERIRLQGLHEKFDYAKHPTKRQA